MASHTQVTSYPVTASARRRRPPCGGSEAGGADIAWEVAEAGAHLMAEHGRCLHPPSKPSERNKVAIKGPVTTPVGTGFPQRERGAAQGARPVRVPAPRAVHPGGGRPLRRRVTSSSCARTPRTCTRASSSGWLQPRRKLIALCEEEGAGAIRPDSGISVKPISTAASERIVRYAFDYAERHGRAQVTAAQTVTS